MIVLVEPFEAQRPHAAPLKLVDRPDQQLAIGGEFLRRVAAAARVDDRAEIVGRHVLAHEPAGGIAHRRAAHRADVEIVEHDHVDPSVERLAIGSRIGRDCPALDDELLRLVKGNVDERERIDLLRLAVFEHREVVARQSGDEPALLVGDDDVHVDVVDVDLKCDAGCLLGLLSQKTGSVQNERKRRARNERILSWVYALN